MKFEEPTPWLARNKEDLESLSARLKMNPDQWALLGQIEGTERACYEFAHELRKGRGGFGHGFEIICRYIAEEFRIYAQYTGLS